MYSRKAKGAEKRVGVVEVKMEEEEDRGGGIGGKKMIQIFFIYDSTTYKEGRGNNTVEFFCTNCFNAEKRVLV